MIFIGDIHGLFSKLEEWIVWNDIKGETLIQVGDLGVGFQPRHRDIEVLKSLAKVLKERNCQLCAIRGNHDNPFYWRDVKHIVANDFGMLHPHIKLIPDGKKRVIDGKTVLFMGGGISIDRLRRTRDVSYWYDEVIDESVINNVDVSDVDIICTHVPPISLTKFDGPSESSIVRDWDLIEEGDLIADLEDEQELLDNLVTKVKESKRDVLWVSGHMHTASYKKSDNIDMMVLAMMHKSRPNPLMSYVNKEEHMNTYNLNGLDDIVGMRLKQE